MITVDHSNYHSLPVDREYLSSHQYANWMECAAREFARQAGKYTPPDKEVFIVGNYVDKALLVPHEFDAFVNAHAEDIISPKSKKKYSAFERADQMIARAKRDEFFMLALQGEHQIIVTWEMFGVWFKAMMDVADPESGYFCDLKTCGAFDQFEWSDFYKRKVPFYERYWLQFGGFYVPAYTAKYGKPPAAVFMAAVTKQDPPDIGIWSFNDLARFQDELSDIENNLPQIIAWKTGKEEPRRCQNCDWCRSTKVLRAEDVISADNPRQRGSGV